MNVAREDLTGRQERWADRWSWGKDRVARLLREFEGKNWIQKVSQTRAGTIYRVAIQ